MVLGYVDLGDDHPHPRAGKAYPVVSASSERVGQVDYPRTHLRRMHLDFYELYVGGRKDFPSDLNHGLLRLDTNTKNPQDLGGSMTDVALVTEFRAGESSFVEGFLRRGVLRNVVLQDWVTLSVELHEIDPAGFDSSSLVRGVLDAVPEIRNLDVLKGIPYLDLANRLSQGMVSTLCDDGEDPLWGELPILEVNPTPGGAFLRTGIYLLGEKLTSKGKLVDLAKLEYLDGKVVHTKGKRLPNYLLFGVSLVEHREE
jgi:hypothetical protein